MSGRPIVTDVRSRTKLQPILGQITSSGTANDATGEGKSEEYLDAMEEALNVRVDGEVELLASGLAELVAQTRIERKDHFQVAQDSFQAAIRTESIVSRSFPVALLSPSANSHQILLFTPTDSAEDKLATTTSDAR